MKRLSLNTKNSKYLIIPILIIFLINLVQIISDKEIHILVKISTPILFGLIIYFIIFLLKKIIKRNPPIEFDQTSLFYNGIVIPLENIISVKMTTNSLNSRYQYKLIYFDKKEKVIKFYPRFKHLNFLEFRNIVTKLNPKADIQKPYIGPFLIEKNKS